MDGSLAPRADISKAIAYPKDWQDGGKHNAPRPFKQYPKMPLIVDGGRCVPVYLDRERLRPLVFQNAREETDYLKANPAMVERFAEAAAMQKSPLDKLADKDRALASVSEAHEATKAERNALENENSELKSELERMQAELAAARARQRGVGAEASQNDPATPGRRRSGASVAAAKAGAES